jgi:hypothetical protein
MLARWRKAPALHCDCQFFRFNATTQQYQGLHHRHQIARKVVFLVAGRAALEQGNRLLIISSQ